MAHTHDQPHIVLNEHDPASKSTGEALKSDGRVVRLDIVQASGRFVQKQVSGLQSEASHKRNSALKTLRQRGRTNACDRREMTRFEKLADEPTRASPVPADRRRVDFQIFRHSQSREQAGGLESARKPETGAA